MSKVNRRKEIKEKEAFQLRFQLALNESNSTVANWLPSQNASLNTEEEVSGADFLNLPILSNGLGLYELEKDDEEQKTISDFVNPEKDPQKLKVQENRQNTAGSKAMAALVNKMRNDSRGRVNNKEKKPQGPPQKVQKKRSQFLGELDGKKKQAKETAKTALKGQRQDDVDSEEEEERRQSAQRSTKKATKVSKRPF